MLSKDPSDHQADRESDLTPGETFVATRRSPIPPTTPIYSDAWWDVVTVRQQESHARLSLARMEVRSYESLVGQSVREDYHNAYADLYGMEPVPGESWANGYTDYRCLSFRLNSFENANDGLVMVQRQSKAVAFKPYQTTVWSLKDLAVSRQCLVVISESFRPLFGGAAVPVAPIPEHRTQVKGGVRYAHRATLVTQQRPTEHVYVDVEAPLAPEWQNPYVIEGGMILLRTAEGSSFAQSGTEGLSVLLDRHNRMHLVHWITRRQRFWAKSTRPEPKKGQEYYWNPGERTRNPAKVPLNVHSFDVATEPEDAITTMKAVAAAMERSCRDGMMNNLLPWMAADLDDTRETGDSDLIYGSDAWLQLVADQRETGQTYRSRGHGPDSDA